MSAVATHMAAIIRETTALSGILRPLLRISFSSCIWVLVRAARDDKLRSDDDRFMISFLFFF